METPKAAPETQISTLPPANVQIINFVTLTGHKIGEITAPVLVSNIANENLSPTAKAEKLEWEQDSDNGAGGREGKGDLDYSC